MLTGFVIGYLSGMNRKQIITIAIEPKSKADQEKMTTALLKLAEDNAKAVVNQSILIFAIVSIASIVMIFKHKENIVRLMNGTEVGLRSANRGEHRIK